MILTDLSQALCPFVRRGRQLPNPSTVPTEYKDNPHNAFGNDICISDTQLYVGGLLLCTRSQSVTPLTHPKAPYMADSSADITHQSTCPPRRVHGTCLLGDVLLQNYTSIDKQGFFYLVLGLSS